MIGRRIKQVDGPVDKRVRWIFSELDRGIRRREKEDDAWDRNEEFENLFQWNGKKGQGDQVTVNKLASYVETHRAAVAFRTPRVKMTPAKASGYEPVMVPELGADGTPKTDEFGQVITRPVIKAKAREALFNNIIGKPGFGLTDTISRLDKAAILGYGALICGYRPEFETPPETDDEQNIPLLEDGGLDFDGYILSEITGLPMKDDNGRYIRKSSIPVWEEWFIDWISYRKIIIDPDGENDFGRHRWVAFEEIRCLDDVKADPLYKNTSDLKETGTADDDDRSRAHADWLDPEVEDLDKRVRLFHFFDFVKDRYVVLADGHDKSLRDEITPDGIAHSPLSFLRYRENLDEFYPRPKASDLVPVNEWYNDSRRMEYVGSRGSLRKVIVDDNMFDDAELEKMTSDLDMEIIKRKRNLGPGVQNSIEVFAPPPVNPSIYGASSAAAADFDEMAGSPEARGIATADTATQSNNLQAGENARNGFERVLMKNCLLNIFKKLNDSIEANMTVERAVELVGTDGQTFVALLDNEMIKGDVEIDIDIHELAPSNNAAMAASRVQLLQMAGSYPHQFSDYLRARGWCEMFNIYDEGFIKSLVEGAQMQIQMAMIEAQPPMPNAAPPSSEADAISQSGAGQQVPAMRGAR